MVAKSKFPLTTATTRLLLMEEGSLFTLPSTQTNMFKVGFDPLATVRFFKTALGLNAKKETTLPRQTPAWFR